MCFYSVNPGPPTPSCTLSPGKINYLKVKKNSKLLFPYEKFLIQQYQLVYDTTKRSIFTQWQITGKVPIKQGLWIVTTTQVVLPFQPACPPSQSKYFPESRNWESASLNASLCYWQAVLSQLNHIIPASGLPCPRLALGFVSCFLLFPSADSQPSLPACCYLTLTFPRLQSSAAFLSHPPAFLRLPYLFP